MKDWWLQSGPWKDQQANTFDTCVALAYHRPDLAGTNAATYKFFALAMYLDDWDWSTGKARKIAS